MLISLPLPSLPNTQKVLKKGCMLAEYVCWSVRYTVMLFTWFTAEEFKGRARGATGKYFHCKVSKIDLTNVISSYCCNHVRKYVCHDMNVITILAILSLH